MQKSKMIAPSTERAKNTQEILQLDKEVFSCASFLHVDIMDGKFVERVLISKNELKEIAKSATLPLDLHLMKDFKENIQELDFYISLKPAIISVHMEAFKSEVHLVEALKKIKAAKILAGVAVDKQTPIQNVFEVLEFADLVVVMSVKAGWGGQKFCETAFEKIETLNAYKKENNKKVLIEVDGGVNQTNAAMLFKHGADILVCGSAVFNSDNRCQTITSLKK